MAISTKTIIFQALLIAFAVVFCIQSVGAQEEVQCLGNDLNMTVPMKAVMQDCLREVGITSIWKVPMAKMACFGVCILERKKLLKDDGTLDHDRILAYIFDVMKPDTVKKPLVEGTEKCIKDHGSKVKQDNDPDCLSYMEVGQCVHEVFLNICVA